MKFNLICLLMLCLQFSVAQVGIGTTDPQDSLDVNGTLRVRSMQPSTATILAGADDNGTVTEVTVGANLSLSGGTLSGSGSTNYFLTSISTPTTSSGQEFHDLDLDLSGTNKNITVFRLINASNNYEITGISGGTDGRHIVLLNIPSVNLRLTNEDTGSLAQNRLTTLNGGFEATSGQGAAELVYDGISERWIVISFRN